jgi:hypothetical protein
MKREMRLPIKLAENREAARLQQSVSEELHGEIRHPENPAKVEIAEHVSNHIGENPRAGEVRLRDKQLDDWQNNV